MKKPKSLKNIIGIMIMIAAAACFLMSFTVQDQDVRGTGNISIFNANEIQEEYYTVDNLKVLECFGVRIEKSMIDEDLEPYRDQVMDFYLYMKVEGDPTGGSGINNMPKYYID